MINNFRVRYTDIERNAPIASVGAKQADVIRHALSAKHGTNFIFEKHDGNSWIEDSEAKQAFTAKKLSGNGKGPDTAFAATLSGLASASAALAKIATRTRLTPEQKSELVSLLRECANSEALSEFFNPTANAKTPASTSTPASTQHAPVKR